MPKIFALRRALYAQQEELIGQVKGVREGVKESDECVTAAVGWGREEEGRVEEKVSEIIEEETVEEDAVDDTGE